MNTHTLINMRIYIYVYVHAHSVYMYLAAVMRSKLQLDKPFSAAPPPSFCPQTKTEDRQIDRQRQTNRQKDRQTNKEIGTPAASQPAS